MQAKPTERCCCLPQVALGTKPNCLIKRFESAAGDKFGWQNGLDSRCAPVTWLFNTYAYQFPDSSYKEGWKDSMCYQSSCTTAGLLQLNILGNKVDCPSGQVIDLAKVGIRPAGAAACRTVACVCLYSRSSHPASSD